MAVRKNPDGSITVGIIREEPKEEKAVQKIEEVAKPKKTSSKKK